MNAARVIKTITKTPIKISEEKEGIEMCQAIEELIAESEARGEVRGKAGNDRNVSRNEHTEKGYYKKIAG